MEKWVQLASDQVTTNILNIQNTPICYDLILEGIKRCHLRGGGYETVKEEERGEGKRRGGVEEGYEIVKDV